MGCMAFYLEVSNPELIDAIVVYIFCFRPNEMCSFAHASGYFFSNTYIIISFLNLLTDGQKL